ncbi:unnamed protein product [Ilex paraguariensis]|uniref:FLZ-type domain-containing protein n=1 Tax=Ilex paraguariensis TaxID=185542 RepID=A0ABC8U601_9AQUA
MLTFLRRNLCASPFRQLYSQNKPLLTFHFTTTTTRIGGHHDESNLRQPPPIRVVLTESAGRGVLATRRITAGELIHTAKPIVCHPSLSSIGIVCYFCLKKLQNKATPTLQVGNATFCSEECREQAKVFCEVENRADWSAFDDHCRYGFFHNLLFHLPVS